MKYDIIIVGAGPAGLAFSCSLSNTPLKILVIEKQSADSLQQPAIDGRDIALTHPSVNTLLRIGAWSRIPAGAVSPIRQARVLDGNSGYTLDFDNDNPAVDALGYLVANHEIRRALYAEFSTVANAKLLTETTVTGVSTDNHTARVSLSNGDSLETALVVAADSRFSQTRRMLGIPAAMRDFGRVAIVCRMAHERSHNSKAYECFHYERTLAVLPLQENHSSVVITVSSRTAATIMNMDAAEFNADVQRRFGSRLGAMQLVGERFQYPLVGVYADRFVSRRSALLGDAAVGMHPVTAHGYNLGLSGATTLAGEIRAALARHRDIGAAGVLEHYQSIHRRISRPLYLGTNGIVGLFTNDTAPAKLLRKLALRLGNNFPPVKHMITNQLTGTHPRTSLPFL